MYSPGLRSQDISDAKYFSLMNWHPLQTLNNTGRCAAALLQGTCYAAQTLGCDASKLMSD